MKIIVLSIEIQTDLLMYTVKEIRTPVLGGYVSERVRLVLRGYILENRGNESLLFLDDERNVTLTNVGRAHFYQ